MSENYQILSQSEVDEFKNAFVEGLQSKARKLIPEDAANNNYILSVITDNLLAAARQRVKIDDSAIAWLAKPNLAQTDKPLRELMQELEKDYFSEQQHESFEKAEAERKDDPVIEKLFGDQKRIYLKCDDVDVESTTRQGIANILSHKGYTITSYKKGYATDAAGKQQFKIGRLLKDDEDARKDFENDPARAGDTLVVISRDTMDIARMSTNRGWKSCMRGDGGDYNRYLPTQIRDGALIAYLVSSRDPEINDPLARITIKSFTSLDEQSAAEEAKRDASRAENDAASKRKTVDSYNLHIERARIKVEILESSIKELSRDAEARKSEAEAASITAADAAAAETAFKENHPFRKHFGVAATRERKAAETNAQNLTTAAEALSEKIKEASAEKTRLLEYARGLTDELPTLTMQAERAERKHVLLEARFNRVSARLEKTKDVSNFAYAASKIYGMGNDAFQQVVESFIEEHLNKGKFGSFEMNKGMYADRGATVLVREGRRPLRAAL